MAAHRQLTPNGKQFFALALYLKHETQKHGRRLQIWKVLKAWELGILRDLSVKIATTQEE